MLPLRTLGMTLLLGWHVMAGGVGNLLHTCRMAAEVQASSCRCPHQQKKDDGSDQLRRADCCSEELVRADNRPAVREGARALEFFAAPVPPALSVALVDETSLPAQVLAWRTGPPSQGPPLFLKVRTLLI